MQVLQLICRFHTELPKWSFFAQRIKGHVLDSELIRSDFYLGFVDSTNWACVLFLKVLAQLSM